MNFKQYLAQVLTEWGWDDETVESNEEQGYHFVETTYGIDGNLYRLFIEGYDAPCLIKIFLYSPISVPERRFADGCVLVNRLNKSIYAGRLDLTDDSVRYRHVVDVEGFEPVVRLVSNMREASANAFRPKIVEAIGALAFTKMKVGEIIAQFETLEDEESSGVPFEL